jgi:hypothetical protein
MREKETYDRMRDTSFRCDSVQMEALDSRHFTSVILRLSPQDAGELFQRVMGAYDRLKELVTAFDREAAVEIYFESAHITIKSLVDGVIQSKADLLPYIPAIAPVVQKWIRLIASETTLYAIGLFTNLHPAKGLSVGVRFYPSLPLIQILRGEIGRSLYEQGLLPLRSESAFHTMLTHSTGFRARHLTFPMPREFVSAFQATVEEYDSVVFGEIGAIQSADIAVRNGISDKLITFAEVSLSEVQ